MLHKLPCRDEATLDIPWAVPRYHSLVRINEIDNSARLPRQHNYLGQHKGTVFRRPIAGACRQTRAVCMAGPRLWRFTEGPERGKPTGAPQSRWSGRGSLSDPLDG